MRGAKGKGRQGSFGFTLVEIGLCVVLVALLLGLGLSALRTGPLRTQTGGAARVVSAYLEQAASQARARGVPVAIMIPRKPQPSALLQVAGATDPTIEGKLNLAADFPGTVLAFGVGDSNESVDLALSAIAFDMQAWSREFLDYRILVFLPSGEVVSRGIPLYEGAYQLLVSAGSEVGPGPGYVPRRVAFPQTVSVGLLGAVSSQAGAGPAFGSPTQATGVLASATEPAPPVPGTPPHKLPVLTRIAIRPDPLKFELPVGIDAKVEPSGYLTLVAEADSPGGGALFCRWQDEQGGRLSSPATEAMTYDQNLGKWVSRWHWRAPDLSQPRYTVTCHVSDAYGRAAEQPITAALTFQISNAKQKALFAAANRFGAVATMMSIYEDGVGEQHMADTPPGGNHGIGAWAPDGSKLMLYGAIVSGGRDDMFMVNNDGGDLHLLSGADEGQGSPEWSPMGTRLCFIYPTTQDPERGRREICIMNADGSGLRQLTNTPAEEVLFAHQGGGYLPTAWSPNEKHIAYARDNDIDWAPDELWVVDTEGANASRRVSGSLDGWGSPAWSADGSRLYMVHGGDIYVYPVDGTNWPTTNPVRVTTGANVNRSLQVSPTNQTALFDSGGAIWEVDVEDAYPTAECTRITSGPGDGCPSWLDEETISFVRTTGGQRQIFVRTSANEVSNITKATTQIFFLGWTPDLSTTGP